VIVEALIAVTFLAALVVLLAPDEYAGRLAFVTSLLPLAGSLYMWLLFDASGNALLDGSAARAFETQIRWLEVGGIELQWFVGVDGVSLPLIVLSTFLTTLAILSAWTPIDERESQFYGLVLFMEANLLGVFTALDFFAWFVFWEAVLVPMYFLIGIWGGPNRKYAAIKFFVYTNVASLVMFIFFIQLVYNLPVDTFGLPAITASIHAGEVSSFLGFAPATVKAAAFAALFLGFAVKVPVVPFHTWLPDAHVEAPTPVSVLLAGVLLKMGTYAMLRYNFTMMPEVAQQYAVPIALFAVVSVIYGALLALGQRDLKRIVAYSSVSSMGYVILGLVAYTTLGVGGATFQMVAHGLISGLMFMSVGVLYNETHTRMVGKMSGLADRMPITVGILVAGAFGYMGLPLMAGFAAEFFIFQGSFASTVLPSAPLFTATAMFGIVIVAGYLLWAMQRTLFGPYELETGYDVSSAGLSDTVPLAVLLLSIVVLGVAPELFFGMITDAITPILEAGGGA
jgi:NADH-quinone oxidoreductase subunit M